MEFKSSLTLTAFSVLLITFFTRLLQIHPRLNPHPPRPRRRGVPTHLLIVLGSGGHTAEMFSLLHSLDPYSYRHRSYVVSSGDSFSAVRAVEFERYLSDRHTAETKQSKSREEHEENGEAKGTGTATYSIHTIPRARAIHQPLLTAPFSALRCLISCLILLRTSPHPTVPPTPDLILLNGPGTAVIVVLASVILRFFALSSSPSTSSPFSFSSSSPQNSHSPSSHNAPDYQTRTRTIYIESWARVRRLSLSGRILTSLGIVDRVLVQWEPLRGVGRGQAEWMGWMVR